MGLLRQQLADAQTVGQTLMEEVRAMQSSLDKPENAPEPEVTLPKVLTPELHDVLSVTLQHGSSSLTL